MRTLRLLLIVCILMTTLLTRSVQTVVAEFQTTKSIQTVSVPQSTVVSVLIAETGTNTVTEINKETGSILWQVSGYYATCASRLSNGDTLICDSNRVVEVSPAKNIVWSASGFTGVYGATRLSNGNTLISDGPNGSVIEVETNGNRVWSFNGLHWPFQASRLSNGNTLIADGTSVLKEINSSGSVVWRANLSNWATSFQRLPNGNTLVGELNGIEEVNNQGIVVWSRLGLNRIQSVQVLGNGNILASDVSNNNIIEINRSGDIVWSKNNLNSPWSVQQIGSIVNEARLDIGMPYNTDRGCSSEINGCGGPFHGFYKGVCTDLVIDAYKWGAPFDIYNAVLSDLKAHPALYPNRSARNVNDMKNYFTTYQKYLDNSQPYQVGDIAFFDWENDGYLDHVFIISEVGANGQPIMAVDASGYIKNYNPNALAFEHAWEPYYAQTVVGHARLGVGNPAPQAVLEDNQSFRITAISPDISLSVFDTEGRSVSNVFDENLVATNNKEAISYIPYGYYSETDNQKIINIYHPLLNVPYTLNLSSSNTSEYTLHLEVFQNGTLSASQIITQTVPAGVTLAYAVTLNDQLGLNTQGPEESPVIGAPDALNFQESTGTQARSDFNISETAGYAAIKGVYLTISDFTTPSGSKLPASHFSVIPASFDVSAGTSRSMYFSINLSNISPGVYYGGFVINSQNAHPLRIPVVLEIQESRVLLPLISR